MNPPDPADLRPSNLRRQMIMSLTMCICIVYLLYRGMFTLNLDGTLAATFSIALYVAEVYGNILMFLFFLQIWEPSLPTPVPPLQDVTVDALIPTYDEDPELVRGTIEAALAMDYPHRTYVLDDGQRPAVRALCEELGAHYISRDSNIHGKAGNLNHALEITSGDYIVFLDSDHIVEPNFITRTLGYFTDEKLAFVQTPHAFYNFDSFQCSLDYERKLYWEEGQLFYNVIQPGKNRWNATSFCGSAAIFRRAALDDVGLIATESITEDMQTGLRLHAQGWKSLYINERLIAGLAAPDLKTFTIQRLRWGEGNLGTIFYDNPLTMKGLTFAQRLNYLAVMLSWTTGVQRLALYVAPLLMLLTGVGPVADLTWSLVAITSVYVAAIWWAIKGAGNGYGRLIDTEITQMASFWTQCRATWRALFRRRKAVFVVTKKSGRKKGGNHRFLYPHYAYIAAGCFAVTWAISRYMLGISEDLLGLVLCSCLVGIHALFAWIVIRRALAQRRFHWRHPVAAHVRYEYVQDDATFIGEGFTKDLSAVSTGFVAFGKIPQQHIKLTITAGDATVTVDGEIKSEDQISSIASTRAGDLVAYRYGVEFKNLTKASKRSLWHICLSYAVARKYHDFDPDKKKELLAPVVKNNDTSMLFPVRLFRPDMGDAYAVAEQVSNNSFSILTEVSFQNQDLMCAKLASCAGDITGCVRRVASAAIQLGQMKLWAHRFEFDTFEGESRGKLTTLIRLHGSGGTKEATSLQPKKTRMPLLYPGAIAAGLGALATAATLAITLCRYQDDVVIAWANWHQQLDETGKARLRQVVERIERAPVSDERQLLRLRNAVQRVGEEQDIQRVDDVLVRHESCLPETRMQQAYALERLGRFAEAKDVFQSLIEDLQVFEDQRTRARLVLAAARNAANLKEHARAIELYARVYGNPELEIDLRTEFASVLASHGQYEKARDVLCSGHLSRDDRFLLAAIHTSLDQPAKARKLVAELVKEDATLRARMTLANLDAWSEEYDRAIEGYEGILADFPNNLDVSIALTQALLWDKQFERALALGKCLLPRLTAANELQVWIPVLQSVSEVPLVDEADRDFVTRVYDHRSNYQDHIEFTHSLALALIRLERFSQAVEVLESMEHLDHEWQYQLAIALTKVGHDRRAAPILDRLLEENAFHESKLRRGELWLVAANNSGRCGSTNEMSGRYLQALPLWRDLLRDQRDNARLWPRYLDAAAGARKLKVGDERLTLDIFDRFASFEYLTEDIEFMTRLIDVMIRLEHAEQVLPESKRLFEQHPQDVAVRLRLANNLHAVGRFEEAASHYDFLIENQAFASDDGIRGQMMISAARNCASLGGFQQSRDIFERMWRLGFRNRDYEVEYTVMLAKTGDEEEAGRLLRREPLNLTQKYGLAATYMSARELMEAAKLYQEILAIQPDEIVARRRWVQCLVWLKKYNQAIAVLNDLLRENHQDTSLLRLLAKSKLWSGQHVEALELLQDLANRLDPESFDLQLEYAAALLFNDQPGEALVRIKRVRNVTPDGLYLLGAIYSRLSKFRSAADVYRQIIRDYPDERGAHRVLADVSAWGRDYDEAIRLYSELLRDAPDDETLQIGLAKAYLWNQQHQQALDIFVPILQQNTGRTDLWPSAVYAASPPDVKLNPRARRVLTAIAQSRSNWPAETSFRLSMVEVMFRLNREAEAIELLREVVAYQPDHISARRRLADELHRLGHYPLAEEHYRVLLEQTRKRIGAPASSLAHARTPDRRDHLFKEMDKVVRARFLLLERRATQQTHTID